MELSRALRLTSLPRLAFSGSGGKTTALFQLARQIVGKPNRTVLVTATTHLAANQISLADHHRIASQPKELKSLRNPWPEGVLLVTGPADDEGRMAGLDPVTIEQLLALADRDQLPLLIEADGSRQKPLKAPADHEPVIPAFVDTVVVVAGLTGLEKPITPEWIHRPERYASLSGLSAGSPVTVKTAANVLKHPKGGLKGIPAHARRVLLLNQADTADLQALGRELAGEVLTEYSAVLVAALGKGQEVYGVYENIAAIVLAAGSAQRFGKPKQLLNWQGQPLIRHVAGLALAAKLSPVCVVTGAFVEEVSEAVSDLPVKLVHNPDWESGQSTSIRAGLQSLPLEIAGVIFFLADQPLVSLPLVRALVEKHATSLAAIVAPRVEDRRANPILFDRNTFPDLSALEGDTGGRALFVEGSPHSVDWVPWENPDLLLDIDTPEDYQRLLGKERP